MLVGSGSGGSDVEDWDREVRRGSPGSRLGLRTLLPLTRDTGPGPRPGSAVVAPVAGVVFQRRKTGTGGPGPLGHFMTFPPLHFSSGILNILHSFPPF